MAAERRSPLRAEACAASSDWCDAEQICLADEPGRAVYEEVSRHQLFATLYVLGILNAFAAVILPTIRSEDASQVLSQLSSISIVIVAAFVVGVHLLRRSPAAAIQLCDWLAATIVVVLILVPHRAASWLAVTGLALFSLGRDRQSTTAVAAASVFLAIAASSFWAPVVVQMFASTLLAWDAALAAALLDVLVPGVRRIGNVIVASDQAPLLVLVGCSFLPNLAYGFLCWMTIARAMRPAWQPTDLLALLAVAVLVVSANTLRLALMGASADSYEWIHGPVSGNVFNVTLLFLIAAIALNSTGRAASSNWCRRSPSGRGEPVR